MIGCAVGGPWEMVIRAVGPILCWWEDGRALCEGNAGDADAEGLGDDGGTGSVSDDEDI